MLAIFNRKALVGLSLRPFMDASRMPRVGHDPHSLTIFPMFCLSHGFCHVTF